MIEAGPPPMASHDKERHVSGQSSQPGERVTTFEADRIAAALRQLYGRIAREPLPQRLQELVNRLKPHR